MPLQVSVCIDAVFEGKSEELALDCVQASGFKTFEFWKWWDRDLDSLLDLARARNMNIGCCCTKFISLVDPGQREAYLTGLEESIKAAKKLGTKTLISQVGDAVPGVDRATQHASLVAGLKEAAPMLEAADITLVIEPLNELVDHAGYYLIRSEEAFDIVGEVNSSHVKVVFDIYHQQISEGHLIQNIVPNINKIGHFHAAGNPGRNELHRGEIHYPNVIDAIRATSFDGYLGLEYWPVEEPQIGLEKVASWF